MSDEILDRVTGTWGYTQREAEFLAAAALHSGYFLRRQYMKFAGAGSGGTVDRFTSKVLAHGHARLSGSCMKTRLYHLCAKRLYAALGEEDNRNRRPREPFTIRQKLMGFDFVLEHRTARFYPTERARVALFTGRGIPVELLPTKFYAGPNGGRTPRAFVDKQPVFLRPESGDLVHFAYIDEGVLSTAGFETWLGQYAPLLRSLGRFVVVYVAASAAFFAPARRRFDAVFGPRLFTDEPNLAEYFRDRRAVDQKDFALLGRAGMDRFRRSHQRLDNGASAALYHRWLVEGDSALQGVAPAVVDGEFRTHLLRYDYNLFGTVLAGAATS